MQRERRAPACPLFEFVPAECIHGPTFQTAAPFTIAGEAAGVAERRNARPRQATRAADVDLADFARTVLAIAEGVEQDPTADDLARGRFGTRKVFIAAVRRGLRDTAYARLPRADVDELMLKARRDGLLSLARADLVAAMDPAELRDSEITHPLIGSTVHFVVSETP
jgi:hypothetical protein